MKKELIDVVRKIRNLNKQQEEYLNKIPNDIQDAFFDNSYVNDASMKNDILMSALFGEVVSEDIFWFMYEYKEGSAGPHVEYPDGTKFTFNTDDDYYKYLETLEIQ
jgi:hypothetical protein